MTDVRVVLMTAPDEESAATITRTLVDERLVACGNLVTAARSVFRWEGAVEDENETVVVLKTTQARVEALVRRIAELHPYDVPEVLVIPVTAGHSPYLDWVVEETRTADGTSEQE